MPNYKLETERLILKTVDPQKDSRVFEKLMNSAPEMAKFMTWDPPIATAKIKQEFIKKLKHGDLPFTVYFKEKEQIIGQIIIRNFIWEQRGAVKKTAFLSFWIHPKFAGKGIGSEILKEICRFSFEELRLRKIFAGTFVKNIPSQKVLKKFGFRRIGISKNHYKKNNRWISSVRFELLSEDFLGEITKKENLKISCEDYPYYSRKIKSLSGKNITLKILEKSDVPEVFEILKKNPKFSKYMTWEIPQDLKETESVIIRMRDKDDLNFGIFYQKKFIGRISLRNFRYKQQNALKNSVFLSFWTLPNTPKKHEIEAVKEILKYCKKELKIHKIFAPTFVRNKRAREILNILNFHLLGRLKKHYEKRGNWYDALRYEIIL